MDGDKQSADAVLGGILWHDVSQLVVAGLCLVRILVTACLMQVGVQSRDQKHTVVIVVEGTIRIDTVLADNVYEFLVQFVGQCVIFFLGQGTLGTVIVPVVVETLSELLIATLKDQAVRVLAETGCELCPHILVFLHGLCADILAGIPEHAPPAIIPVVIDDDIHLIVQCVVENFLHTVHIGCIDLVIGRSVILLDLFHHIGPGYRNTDRIDAVEL